jgi:hypothetical protein
VPDHPWSIEFAVGRAKRRYDWSQDAAKAGHNNTSLKVSAINQKIVPQHDAVEKSGSLPNLPLGAKIRFAS